MSVSTVDSMRALRDADPAAGIDVTALCPDWESILVELTSEAEPAQRRLARPLRRFARPRRRPLRRWGVRIVVAAVAVGAIVAGAVNWPWSQHGPATVAYGVTKRADGTVAVRVSFTHPLQPADLQSRLEADGVSALVLVESAPGTCADPAPTTIPSTGQIISIPTNIAHGEGFVVTPAGIPPGAVLVIALPAAGVLPAGSAPIAGLWITATPPSCVGQAVTGPAATPAESTDASPSK